MEFIQNAETLKKILGLIPIIIVLIIALPWLIPAFGGFAILILLPVGIIIGTLVMFGDDILVASIVLLITLTLLFFGICILLRIRRNKKILKQQKQVQDVRVSEVQQIQQRKQTREKHKVGRK